jgi:site-specific recombinase XerD
MHAAERDETLRVSHDSRTVGHQRAPAYDDDTLYGHQEGTMRVYKRRGQWWIDIRYGTERSRLRGCRLKSDTDELAEKIGRLIDRRRIGASLTPDLLQWLEEVESRIVEKLHELRIVDRSVTQATRDLAEQLDDYEAHLEAKANTAKHVQRTISACRKIIDAIGARTFDQLTADRVEHVLHTRRDTRAHFGIASSNHWLTAIKGFVTWAVRNERTTHNRLASLSKLNPELDRRVERRVLSLKDLLHLFTMTDAGPVRYDMTGPDRRLLYAFAAATGFRANECRQLTVGSFDLEAGPPFARLPATASKRRRVDYCPWLPAWLVADLKSAFATKLPTAWAFTMPEPDQVSRMLQEDLRAAKIEYTTKPTPDHPHGLVFDFHALRHTFSTHAGQVLSSGRDLQEVLRVSDAKLVTRYTHPDVDRIREAMERMPNLSV